MAGQVFVRKRVVRFFVRLYYSTPYSDRKKNNPGPISHCEMGSQHKIVKHARMGGGVGRHTESTTKKGGGLYYGSYLGSLCVCVVCF